MEADEAWPGVTFKDVAQAGAIGPDLHLEVKRPRVRASLEDAIRRAMADGRLRPGARLPSSRVLAQDLRVTRNTVAEVYAQLVAEGWLTACRGAGTRVAETAAAIATRATQDGEPQAKARTQFESPGRPAQPGRLSPQGMALRHPRGVRQRATRGARVRRPSR